MILGVTAAGHAQNYSTDVSLVSLSGNTATLLSSATAEKKKEAEQLALKSAIYAVLADGVEGLKDGTPMVTDLHKDYLYRLMNEKRYVNFIVGVPTTVSTQKVAGMQRATVQVAVNLKALRDEAERNKMTLSPNWADGKKAVATASLNPMIVIVPYVDASRGYSFEAMRDAYESDNLTRYVIDQVAGAFQKNGYKTYDFINILEDSKLNDILRQGAQTDDATMIVQQIPGDIIVTAEVDVNSAGGISDLSLHLRAFEKQTSGRLATQSFGSGKLHTTDYQMLANHAVGKIQKDFFDQLSASFNDMVKKGREVTIDLNLSESVDDWDFEQDSPATGVYFKDALDDWLRENSVNQVYDMSRSTDKYVRISVNVPLWDMERNRPFTLNNFGGQLRGFFRKQLGDMYKANVTSMGQKMVVTIE